MASTGTANKSSTGTSMWVMWSSTRSNFEGGDI